MTIDLADYEHDYYCVLAHRTVKRLRENRDKNQGIRLTSGELYAFLHYWGSEIECHDTAVAPDTTSRQFDKLLHELT